MRNFKRFIAFVLCAVMLAGVAPVTFRDAKVVAAQSRSAETSASGVIQGDNDIVVVLYKTATTVQTNTLDKALTVSNTQVNAAISKLITSFDRAILVIGTDVELIGNTSKVTSGGVQYPSVLNMFADATTGAENLVITQKCTVTNPNYVFALNCTSATGTSFTHYEAFTEDHPAPVDGLYNFYNNSNADLNKKLTMPSDVNATHIMKLGHDLEINYINIHFPCINQIFYANGFDLTIGKYVKFTYGGNQGATYRPIVVNGGTRTGSFADNKQTITLLGGVYQYCSPRSRTAQNTYEDITIDLIFGDIRFVHVNYMALFGNDIHDGTTINVHLDGTDFRDPVYILGATESGTTNTPATVPTVTDSTVNIYMNKAYFDENGGIVGSLIPSSANQKAYSVNGLEVNLFIKYAEFLNTETGVYNTFKPGIDSEGNEVANITTNVYYDEIGMPSATYGELVYNNFDNCYTVSVEDSSTTLCGTEGQNTYVYKDSEGNPAPASWTIDAFQHSYHSEVLFNVAGDYGVPAYVYCRSCHYAVEVETTEDGAPVIYVDSVNGNNANCGYTPDVPKQTLLNASQAVAKFNRGGTIVICGNSTFSGTVLADVGGTLTITSMENGEGGYYTIQFTETLTANSHLVFETLHFKETENVKTIFMNYNDLYVDSTCVYHKDLYDDTFKLAVVAGARASAPANVEDYATDVYAVQDISLDALDWAYVFAGSKSTIHNFDPEGDTGNEVVASSPDLAVNCTGSTNIWIYSGANAAVVDLVNNGVDSYLYLDSYADSTIELNSVEVDEYVKYESEAGVTKIFGNFDTVSSAEHVYVMDPERFGAVSYQEKKDGDTLLGGRVTYTTGTDFAAWVDTAAVEEFGVLMSLEENAAYIKYISTSHANGIGKSICYDDTRNEYFYAGGDSEVVFSGTILCQDEEGNDMSDAYIANDFAALPYAVVNSNVAGGKYTVIGDYTYFNYNGIVY